MKVSHKDNGSQSSKLEITLEQSDYLSKYQAELKKVRAKAAIKGFRQGKTPKSVIEKMYGRSILAEAVNGVLQEKLWDAIEEQKWNVILSPIISEDQEAIDFNPKDLTDYDFTFEVGHKPEFELKGADKESSITAYKIVADDEIVDKEFEMVRKRLGEEVKAEKDINNEDRITIEAVELSDKGSKKRNGWETAFQVLVSTLDEKYLKEVEGKDVGHTFEFDIYEIEKDRNEDYVKKYLLNLDEEEEKEIGKIFRGEIKEISRIEPAEVNQEFFDKYLGEGVASSEEDVKNRIRENISEYYNSQSKAYLRRDIMDKLIEENPMELPKEFVKVWLLRNNDNLTEEQVDSELDAFLTNMKWDLISEKVKEQYPFEVEPEDIRSKVRAQIMQYFGGQMPNMDIEPLVDNLMKDQNQFRQAHQEASSEKLLDTLADNITLVEEEVSIEKFGDLVKEMNERVNKK